MKFTLPRLWRGGCWNKFLVIFNGIMIISNKVTSVLVPLLLKEVIDAIICDESKTVDMEKSYFIKTFKADDTGCPSSEETYILIGFYAGIMFFADFLNYMREIPYATMSAQAEISIAHDVYDHVQRQSLAFHLSRETGKIIRIVSRGSQSFASVLRMITFNLIPL